MLQVYVEHLTMSFANAWGTAVAMAWSVQKRPVKQQEPHSPGETAWVHDDDDDDDFDDNDDDDDDLIPEKAGREHREQRGRAWGRTSALGPLQHE